VARWFEAVLAWLGISVFLGLLFSVGGQGLLGLSSGATPSLSALTQRGQLLPASALLPVGAVLLMLRKPANLLRLERVAVGIFCLALSIVATLWWGETLTLYTYNGPVDASFISGGSARLYGLSVVVSLFCVARAERS